MKRIGVFGSTGSVGQNALEICRTHSAKFEVGLLAAGSNVETLVQQAIEFRPQTLVLGDKEASSALEDALGPEAGSFELLYGPDGLLEGASRPELDIVLCGITGSQGLPVSLGAVKAGNRLALANKESMVMAGPLLLKLARENQAEVVPIDSEHSAIFQCLLSGNHADISRLILTASGGPFRNLPKEGFSNVTIDQALAHPTWNMGPKISIDSATMFNKALEIVEARWMFDVPADAIEVCIHPQSIVHSMVLWRDGCVMAQMGAPDMKVPIQYAMTYPERLDTTLQTWSPTLFNGLEFLDPDPAKFPSLALGFLAAERGGTLGAVLNAANEVAVASFFEGRIRFDEIFDHVAEVVDRHDLITTPDLEDIMNADAWAREELVRCC